MTTEHDYNKTIDALECAERPLSTSSGQNYRELRDDLLLDFIERHLETVRHALRVAKKLAEEPSDECLVRALNAYNGFAKSDNKMCAAYRAMREQIYKEIETN